jgi:uncharacterized protein YbjT (DUF2867 family)
VFDFVLVAATIVLSLLGWGSVLVILLTGGTGVLGSEVLDLMLKNQYPVRVFTRGGSDWRSDSTKELQRAGAEAFLGDIRDPNRLSKALEGCKIVVNCAGLMQETAEEKFQEVHVDSIIGLIAMCEQHDIKRFVHVSCLGASPHSANSYYRTKGHAEEFVKTASFYWTIFRPAWMFGDRFFFGDLLLPAIKSLPVVPLIGGGLNRIQPVAASDVARCVVQSIYDKGCAGKTYDLAGPQNYSVSELTQKILGLLGKRKPTMTIPSDASIKFLKLVERVYPKGTINQDLLERMVGDCTGDSALMQENFQVDMISLDDKLPELIAG